MMKNIQDAILGQEQQPREVVRAENTGQAQATESSKQLRFNLRLGAPISWLMGYGCGAYRMVIKYSTGAIIRYVVIPTILSWERRAKTPDTWSKLAEHLPACVTAKQNSPQNRCRESLNFVKRANPIQWWPISSISVKAMFATSTAAGGAL
jgi:hypothetical protein